MNYMNYVRLRIVLPQTLALVTLAGLMTGCNIEAHDSLDTHPPGNMPTAAGTKPAAKALSKPAPPAPTEAEMGMPIYPNATTYMDALGNPIPALTTGESKQAVLSTPDSMDKVIAFYKSRLTETDASGASQPATPRQTSEKGKTSTILTGNDAAGNILMAIVHEESGKTTIELMHTHAGTMPASVSGDPKSGSAKPETATPSDTRTPSTSQNASTSPIPSTTQTPQKPLMSMPNSKKP